MGGSCCGDWAMKITNLVVRRVDVPHSRPYRGAWQPPDFVDRSRTVTIVKIETDVGLVGWGIGDVIDEVMVREVVAPELIGKDPGALDQHIDVLRRTGAFLVDMALCDLVGKAAGQPLHQLWGYSATRVRAYASTIVAATPEQRAEDALRYLEQGFTAIKLRIAFSTMDEDIALVTAVRNAVGDRMEIMVDANYSHSLEFDHRPSWSYSRALATARELEQLDVVWLEEPLARDDLEGLARLTAETGIAIAGGEGDLGVAKLNRLLEVGAYDILQADCSICEGLSQFIRLAAAAEFCGRQFIPHHGCTGLGLAAHMQLSACVTNSPYVEFILDPPYRTVEVYQQLGGIVAEPQWIDSDGYLPVPTGPGLGVDVDEAAIAQYEVSV